MKSQSSANNTAFTSDVTECFHCGTTEHSENPQQQGAIGQSKPQPCSLNESTGTVDSVTFLTTESVTTPDLASSNTKDSFPPLDPESRSDVAMAGSRFQSQNEKRISYSDGAADYALSAKIPKIGNMSEDVHIAALKSRSDRALVGSPFQLQSEKTTSYSNGVAEYPLSAKTMRIGNTSEATHAEQFTDVKLSHIESNCEIVNGDDFVDNPTSPKMRMDHIAAPCSPRDLEENSIEKETVDRMTSRFRDEHVSLFHLGPFKTVFAIVMTITAFSFSVACKHSTSFVRLEIPLEVGSHYNDITTMGLFYLEMCRTKESVSVDNGIVTISDYIYADDSTFNDDPIDTIITQISEVEYAKLTMDLDSPKVCKKIRLDGGVIGDGLWNSTRIFAGFTEWLGGFLALTLICACCWKTMNLVPIAIGLLLNYMFQSLSFLFFETKLCKENGCFQSRGGDLAIGAIICWFLAWIGVLYMIMHAKYEKRKANLLRQKQEIATAIYAKKRKNRVRVFMHNQLSFLKLFSSARSPRVAGNTSETSMSSGPSSDSDIAFVTERVEV